MTPTKGEPTQWHDRSAMRKFLGYFGRPRLPRQPARDDFNSMLMGLHRLSAGATAALHHDATLEGEQPHGTITADIYLTVIAPDRKTACVDAPVPHFKAMRPVHTVVRDTIFLLGRRLNRTEDGLESWVRMYGIDTSECTWLDLD